MLGKSGGRWGAAAEIRGLGGDISALGKGIEEPSKYCRKRANITITRLRNIWPSFVGRHQYRPPSLPYRAMVDEGDEWWWWL